ARAPRRLPHRRGRRIPRARLRRCGAAEPVEPRAGRGRAGGDDLEDVLPGVRLGWAAGPREVVAQLVSAKQNTDQCASALAQRLFEQYVRRGWIDEQLAASRELYARKCARLLDALAASMPETVRWTSPRGGFFSWLTVPDDAGELARRAVELGVAIVPGAPFFP